MLRAFDTLLQMEVSANAAAANSDNEAFRYECLCCGEEVFLAAQDSVHKATHFRHRSGNNDKDCELYLGQYGIVPTSPSSRNRRTDRLEFYYQNLHKAFYMSFRFSNAEIEAYENANSCIEVRTSRNQKPFFSKRINHTNFADDIPERFMLEVIASPYYISNTVNNIKREYRLFSDKGPTFFKIQGEESDFTAKYIKSDSLYTSVKYFIAWPGQNTAQIYLSKVPGVEIEDFLQFKTMNNCTVWALIATFTDKNPKLDALLQSWGYDLNTAEQLTLLWPPAYENDETHFVSSNSIFVNSSFVLQASGNTNAASNTIHRIDDVITRIEVKDKLRILKKNAELSVEVRPFSDEIVSHVIHNLTAKKFVVPDEGTFYCYSSFGVERLSPGQIVFLTETSSIVEYCGNYIFAVILLPREEGTSLSEKIQDAVSYYWVSIPYEKEMSEVQLKEILEHLPNGADTGYANKAVLDIYEEDKHV